MSFTGKKNIYKLITLTLLIFFSCVFASGNFLDEANAPSPLNNKSDKSVYALQNTIHDIYELYKDSVVYISTEKTVKLGFHHPNYNDPFFKYFFGPGGPYPNIPDTMKQKGLGTGFIVSSDGYICTNFHVVAEMDSVKVKVNNKEYNAKIVGGDAISDIALLKIDANYKFKPVFFGDSDSVKIGDMAIAIGNPFGFEKTLTLGIISATGRNNVDELGNSYIQTDASINPGNSGGPLINMDGEVIGMNRMIYSQTGGSMGIGFATPINMVKEVLIQLKNHGKIRRGYLGVQIQPISEDFARNAGLKSTEGALVHGVMPGSPASEAGLRINDVITKINKETIRDFKDLFNIISKVPVGNTVKITVWRDRKENELQAVIKERP